MQCNVLQSNAMQCIDEKQCNEAMQCSNAMQCNVMQCNAMQCNAKQCNAMQCNVKKTVIFMFYSKHFNVVEVSLSLSVAAFLPLPTIPVCSWSTRSSS